MNTAKLRERARELAAGLQWAEAARTLREAMAVYPGIGPQYEPSALQRLDLERMNELATEWERTAADARLFMGVYCTGIAFADRTRERDGDYARLAFMPYSTLALEFAKDCPPDMRREITARATAIQARRGQDFPISAAGQTVRLGK